MVQKHILSLSVAAALAIGAQASFAAAITTTYAGSADFGAGGVGYITGSVAPNPNSSTALTAVGIGGDKFVTSNLTSGFSPTGSFTAWCVDIYHWMVGSQVTYQIGTGADLASTLNYYRPGSPTGATRVQGLIDLANDVYSTVNTQVESAAFQLAVWAITYGAQNSSGKYVIDTTNSGFRVDTATATGAAGVLANNWLTNLGAATADTGNYAMTYLYDNVNPNPSVGFTQDVVVFTAVPEPATLSLLGLGLLGLGWRARKKS